MDERRVAFAGTRVVERLAASGGRLRKRGIRTTRTTIGGRIRGRLARVELSDALTILFNAPYR